MNSRERVLTALDGREPDRAPCALNFYRVEVASLAPPGQWRQAMVDVRFVFFPPSPELRVLYHILSILLIFR